MTWTFLYLEVVGPTYVCSRLLASSICNTSAKAPGNAILRRITYMSALAILGRIGHCMIPVDPRASDSEVDGGISGDWQLVSLTRYLAGLLLFLNSTLSVSLAILCMALSLFPVISD